MLFMKLFFSLFSLYTIPLLFTVERVLCLCEVVSPVHLTPDLHRKRLRHVTVILVSRCVHTGSVPQDDYAGAPLKVHASFHGAQHLYHAVAPSIFKIKRRCRSISKVKRHRKRDSLLLVVLSIHAGLVRRSHSARPSRCEWRHRVHPLCKSGVSDWR